MFEQIEKAKKSFQKFYEELTQALPINDFLPKFFAEGLLPGLTKSAIESKPTRREKVEYFLDEVIKRGIDIGYYKQFETLLHIMKTSDDSVSKHLAEKITDFRSGKLH